MGAHGVSQAAAQALRQLQDQLAAAYTDLAACQEENAALRADARDIIQAQHAEVVSSEARATKAEEDHEATQGLLRELKTALEATLVDNAKCKAEVAQLAELKLALESCRVALQAAKERQKESGERAAAAASAQRSAEAAAAAAERRAADAECLRREGSSAAVHAQSQLQSFKQCLQEQKKELERLGNSNALLEFRCDSAEARADALQAEAAEAANRHAQEAASLKERLKEEEGRRKAGEEQALRMDGVLTALRQEATALRLAADEHAKGVCEMRVTAEAAQRFLDQERGMRDALTNALQHTETTMQRVLSLNHALVESFAEPLILATCWQQQLQAAPDLTSSVPRRAEASASHHHRRQTDAEEALEDRERAVQTQDSHKSDGGDGNRPAAHDHVPAAQRPVTNPDGAFMEPSRDTARIDPDTLENRILPAIARHMAEIKQQQAASEAQPKQAARVRGTTTFTSSSGQRGGTRGIPPSTAGAPSTTGREQVEAVVMSLEDELAVLDLRYAELLRQQQHHRQCANNKSSSNDLDLEEEVAHAAARVREAMQRKGQQIQQLWQYTAVLKT
ncbi:hypothetical protein COCSUDRAFT_55170 [Coccomyxa subellipsoidea C-169]|uniref:Uncharacterized protein n=1 Tax=Coccomyxa subellipsoidea (strain C-169) TaxID=574566 RepID=I0Z927_COCSC|nr:hypothetical protein COCSUDRAFT_55170 [Coccomyxa subellipsoidea C-169]EIE27146.1 hypothetical protein COCSUDRAFT_55170 [Coccomyxa subellipsoidea C-169]|eukprot:XP_005651690.1 hypothetical protein COCSUDRAFT_55170 [Coccomyxa subellipsoidea C-169]